jgi:hypothetical protein
MGINQGDLIRWVIGHSEYAAGPNEIRGIAPIYKYGIVIEVSKIKKTAIIAHCYDCNSANLVMLDQDIDVIEIISESNDG